MCGDGMGKRGSDESDWERRDPNAIILDGERRCWFVYPVRQLGRDFEVILEVRFGRPSASHQATTVN